MKGLTIRNIISAVDGKLCGNTSEELLEKEVTGVAIDSRKIEEGHLYVPIVGNRVDGHTFIEDTFEKGALCTLSERELDIDKPYILVDSDEEALKSIAALYRENVSCKVIGVVGSVGKTSTKESLASVLSEKYKVMKTEGNFNNEIGVPLTIFRIKDDDEIAVLEMGISDFGEMHRLSRIAKPDMVVMTNIGTCHLENLKSRDGVLKAKSEVFDFISKSGAAILNGDDDKLKSIGELPCKDVYFYGLNNDNDSYAVNLENKGLLGTSFNANVLGESFDMHVPVAGEHMVYNALAAATCGKALGMSGAEISEGIKKLKTIGGRNNIIKTSKYMIIDDCYNANPMSMKASISVLKGVNGRRVAILGDMFELGDDEKLLHAEVGEAVAKAGIDKLIAIGELSKNIYEKASEGGIDAHWFETKEEMLTKKDEIFKEGDTILIKASHGMDFAKLVDTFKED